MIPGLGGSPIPSLTGGAATATGGRSGDVSGGGFHFGGIQTGGSNMPAYVVPLIVGAVALFAFLYLRKR